MKVLTLDRKKDAKGLGNYPPCALCGGSFTRWHQKATTKEEHMAFTPLRCNAVRLDVDQSTCSVSNHARVLELELYSKNKNSE